MGKDPRSPPQDPFQQGVLPPAGTSAELKADELMGNSYLEQITDSIAPTIINELELDSANLNKAVIGSSMGGLASLYALTKRPDFFTTSLALSTHWSAGEFALVEALVDQLPPPGNHKIWMSHGTRGLDSHYSPFQERANEKMKSAGWVLNENYMTRVYQGARHNERAWSRHLDQPITFWLKEN
ncbi:MAG: alpha/beta hydrolase-fold protein [Actinomycetota bacterium]